MQTPPNICPQCNSPIPADAPGGLCPACVLLGVAGRTNPSQAAAANAPTMEEVAAAFPELEVLDILGQGGMGIVFKARQPRLDRFVALKVLPPALAAHPGFAERFTREARVLARLAHPNIVSIYDFGESAGFFYLIMEFVNGVNLRAAMRAGVTPEQALLLVPRICEALQFAHDHGVLHRDIKPENILLDTAGTPKLADFGIAKLAGEESGKTGLTATGAALGTAVYMAPEQVEKPATVDHRADIYSLGVVLYEMLTGELPLGRFAAPSEKSTVNRGVDDVVMRALEKERERRQQSATEMKTQVEGASHAGMRAVTAAATALTQDGFVTRVLGSLAALSAIGIPITGMMDWDAPNPRHMVVFTILFGTLAGLSKMFVPPTTGPVRPRDPVEPFLHAPPGFARKVALAGLLLMLAPLAAVPFVFAIRDSHGHLLSEIFDHQRVATIIVGIPIILAPIAGVIATLTALLGYRFRARWFFWSTTLAALAMMLMFGQGREFNVPSILCVAVIGYCVFYYREFFAPPAAASRADGKSMPDSAPNPWPHRLFWLIVSLLVLPIVAVVCAILIPRLSMIHNNHGAHLVGWAAAFAGLLPFIAGAALYVGYRITRPGADQATPRAAWNPWPKRIFLLVAVLIALPATLIGFALAVPMIAYRRAEPPIYTRMLPEPPPPYVASRPGGGFLPAPVAIAPTVSAAPASAPVPVTRQATPAVPAAEVGGAPDPRARTGPSANITHLQDENIRLAREHYNAVKENVDKAVAPRSELAAAERDLAVAEARDDEISIATALVAYAEYQHKMVQEAAQAKTVSQETVRDAERELNNARLRLERAWNAADIPQPIHAAPKSANAGRPAPGLASTPAMTPPAASDNPAIARLQDESIRTAREQLDTTKKRVEAGVATPIELAAAERNLAVAEARDDELKAATALVAYAETRSRILREQVKAGTATSLEGLDAEQELNTARLRLEKAKNAAEVEKPHDSTPKVPATPAAVPAAPAPEAAAPSAVPAIPGTAAPEAAPGVEKAAPTGR